MHWLRIRDGQRAPSPSPPPRTRHSAFRERKERYVKELEARVQELEQIQKMAEGGELSAENLKLRRKLEDLECENRLLRDASLNNFEFNVTETTSFGDAVPKDVSPSKSESTANVPPKADASPPPAYNSSPFSPFSSGASDLTSLDNESFFFDDLRSSPGLTSEGGATLSPLFETQEELISQMLHGAGGGVKAGAPDPFALLPITKPGASFPTLDPLLFSANATSAAFTTYRDPTAAFDLDLGIAAPIRTSALDSFVPQAPMLPSEIDDFLATISAPTPVPAPAAKTPCPGLVEVDDETKADFERVKAIVGDSIELDDLCDLFKAKAHCKEMADISALIVGSAENGNKAEVIDLVQIAKERKRMAILRQKAGVTAMQAPLC
ncbi:hypothetical protein BDK51DRAFT_28978 [Blyttiomyces helicus]|uniref:BZIP domain-containing protein n=1 Tax=Blyttiomyces helicus TaxID=388810 RepID=A0A4P9W251_9FUNG|nr:hypothetical protein BDK51DRAFT_28978 [Blyttiomyces helicus]|eukprot:RKO86289.1 hypothetical protein BDK51DRAFT_28978 [Blyttiomyces helicus]